MAPSCGATRVARDFHAQTFHPGTPPTGTPMAYPVVPIATRRRKARLGLPLATQHAAERSPDTPLASRRAPARSRRARNRTLGWLDEHPALSRERDLEGLPGAAPDQS